MPVDRATSCLWAELRLVCGQRSVGQRFVDNARSCLWTALRPVRGQCQVLFVLKYWDFTRRQFTVRDSKSMPGTAREREGDSHDPQSGTNPAFFSYLPKSVRSGAQLLLY